jgi:uncharacterized protein YkwD
MSSRFFLIAFIVTLMVLIPVLSGCAQGADDSLVTQIAETPPVDAGETLEVETIIPTALNPTESEIIDSKPTATIQSSPTPELTLDEMQPSESQDNQDIDDQDSETQAVSPTPTPTTQPTAEVADSDQQSENCIEKAAFFSDITIPDGTFFYQGEEFVKTWRFRNEGTCSWTPDYAMVFHSGDNMSAPLEVPFPETILPNEQVNLTIEMKAPTRGGEHRSNWEFKNPNGKHFGVGFTGRDLFWVVINVRFLDQNDEPQPDPSTSPPPESPASCNVQRNAGNENLVINLINQARNQNGLDSLSIRQELTASALVHSTDMACNNFVGHAGSNGSHWSDRIVVQGYAPGYSTENIYVGNPEFGGTPTGAFDWWMNSQVHRDNILDPKVREIGVGYVYLAQSDYGGYYTINFAQP